MGFRRCFVMCAVLAIIPSLFVPICTSAKTFLLACVIRILQGSIQNRRGMVNAYLAYIIQWLAGAGRTGHILGSDAGKAA
ncbi:unnamed protein product [Nippostrongylus brasiliensis]|uniref:Secreted protein n=1 Tax=Nippostrongylus brasiliensis TaxID=27835 RepID=A0A0N4XRV0_NIPBR|nr:unnamed protein product [Nippostrongylus brasiliensis]